MKCKWILIAIMVIVAPQARAEVVLSAEIGLAIMGSSGLPPVGPLERDEVATTQTHGVSIGYQFPVLGGRLRGLLGYERLNADGDWGVDSAGDTARQTVDIATTGYVLGAEYDFLQVKAGILYPFVGAGVRLNVNRPAHGAIIDHADGSQTGCVGDDADTTSFGWHGLVGVGADFDGGWTARLLYQYTDRGSADMRGDNCPTWRCTTISPGSFRITDHSVRLRVSYAF